jgi:menaquinone-dependent protoporphyrinogen oxidase
MAPHVLIATASRHGSTLDIGDEIGRVLVKRGLTVTDKPAEDVESVTEYDAVLLGSAVYAGHWLAQAVDFVKRHAAQLAQRPVWLFSSGPVGEPAMPETDPVDLPAMIEQSQAREHRVFAGRLDPERLGMGEKLIVRLLRAPRGDFRNWPAIDDWADAVANELLAAAQGTAEHEEVGV